MESQILKFENTNVRTNIVNDTVWFCAKDVCQILGIKKYLDMMQNLDDDERTSMAVDTLGGSQNMTFINESGIYECIFRSRHPDAKKFKKWIKTDVLPSIRQTGKYNINQSIKNKKYYEDKHEKILKDTQNVQINSYKTLYEIFEKVGEDRHRIICLDNLKNLATQLSNVPTIEDKSKLISLSERIYNDMNMKPTKALANKILVVGKDIKLKYVLKYKENPQKCMKYVNGHNAMINCYKLSDYEEWIDLELKCLNDV
jgi:prophage antirepressor-like protein